MMPIDINTIAILIIHGVNYCCIIFEISKTELITFLINSDLKEKSWSWWNMKSFLSSLV